MQDYEREGIHRLLLSTTRKYKMFGFMCSLLILLLLSALLENYEYAYLVLNTFSMVVIIAGVYAADAGKKSIIILIILALPWLIAEWVFLTSTKTVYLGFFFFLYVISIFFERIVKTKDVTPDTLYAAACVYLLLGLLWASIYGLIDHVIPGAVFKGSIAENTMTTNEVVYFSYTTLTTLGYGDITSVTSLGRIASVLEAIIGQLFIAFLVARLVAIYTSKTIKES